MLRVVKGPTLTLYLSGSDLTKNMPAKNIVKEYIREGYYHIYNRGVEKRNIFLEESDCNVFLFYLKMYLSPIEELQKLFASANNLNLRLRRYLNKNLSQEIDLLSFGLMPNHFHFQIKQHTETGMIKLMRRVITSYVMYFNNKYQRVGALFQGRYKARIIETDAQLLHLSRYIHLNARGITSPIDFKKFSSYDYYLGKKSASWIKPQEILSFFSQKKHSRLGRTLTEANDRVGPNRKPQQLLSYESFVENYFKESKNIIKNIILESDDETII